MGNKSRFWMGVLGVLMGNAVMGQGSRGGTVPFDLDMALFRASGGWSYLEVYFSVPRDALRHTQGTTGYEGRLFLDFALLQGDSLLVEKKDTLVDPIESLDVLREGMHLYHLQPFYLKPGNYRLRCRVEDPETGESGWVERPLAVSGFPPDSLLLSDIQLATQIRADTLPSPYAKNGYTVIPNAAALYGLETPILFFYVEIYGLSSLKAGEDSTFTVAGRIEDLDGKEVKRLHEKERIRREARLVWVDRLQVANLPSGTYRLILTVEDHGSRKKTSKDKGFFVYRRADFTRGEGQATLEASSQSSLFDGMSMEELDTHFGYCAYLATRQEKRAYKKLDLEGKRQFLKAFWQKRDENPGTPINETLVTYLNRVEQSNQRFGSVSTPGWKTDQGRVWILYGEPDEIERFPGDMGRRYYEIWHYRKLEGHVFFVFIDLQRYGKLQLVHSTHPKEIHDYQWTQLLE